MAVITNNLINSVDFSGLPNALQETISSNPIVIRENVFDGWGAIRSDFEVIESDEKTPLLSLQIMDILKPASDDFDPTADAIKWGARLPDFHDIEIDLSLKRSQVLAYYRSYLKYIAGFKNQNDVLANPWPLFLLGEIMKKAGRDLAITSAYRATRNNSLKGALYVLNGLLYHFTAGRASGDIPSGNVYDSVTTYATGSAFDADVYDEVNAIAVLTEANPDLAGQPLVFHMSPRNYRLYNETRRAKSPNTISLSEKPTVLDDYPNISIKVDQGLGSQRFMFITVPGNLFFTFNEDYSNMNLKMIEQVKGWELNIMFSAGITYGVGRLIYSNNRTD